MGAMTGNAMTSVIVTLSPALLHFDTSIHSLRFASAVAGIKREVTPNTASDPDSIIKRLKGDVDTLKQQLVDAEMRETNKQTELDQAKRTEEDLRKELEEVRKELITERTLRKLHGALEKSKGLSNSSSIASNNGQLHNEFVQTISAQLERVLELSRQSESDLNRYVATQSEAHMERERTVPASSLDNPEQIAG